MHLPHPLLTLPVAAACWLLAGAWHSDLRAPQAPAEGANPLAICRSAYGSLIARLMKNSLHSYWHAGCTDPTHGHAPAPAAAAAPGPAGRFTRRAASQPQPQATVAENTAQASWVERWGKTLVRLEHMRTARNSPFAVAPAHRRFLSASADWRVHLAWQLDPGDAALYEIDHFTTLSRGTSADTARTAASDLARRTIQHALSPHAGPADALTGAGAAINLLNDKLQPGKGVRAEPAKLLQDWRVLELCLSRHRELRQQAYEEDWWPAIPEMRRQEIESYAKLLEKLSGTIRQQLASNGLPHL